MSDTPAEMRDHEQFVRLASGKVLVAGLGLGMVAMALAEKPEVTHVAVIEKEADVIRLVAEHLTNPKIQIVHADIHDYKAWYFFDYAWFDIWGDLCTDDLKEMSQLQRKFKKWVGHSGCWAKELLQQIKRRDNRERRSWGSFGRMDKYEIK